MEKKSFTVEAIYLGVDSCDADSLVIKVTVLYAKYGNHYGTKFYAVPPVMKVKVNCTQEKDHSKIEKIIHTEPGRYMSLFWRNVDERDEILPSGISFCYVNEISLDDIVETLG